MEFRGLASGLLALLVVGAGVVLVIGSSSVPARRSGSALQPGRPAAGDAPVQVDVASAAAAEKVKTISRGERVELAANAVAGGRTIFEFYADW